MKPELSSLLEPPLCLLSHVSSPSPPLPSAQDEEVIQHFGAEAVEAVRLVRDARSGAGKGVAFVLFRSQEASRAALAAAKKVGRALFII